MASKINNTEWGLVIGAAAVIDLFQFILDLFLIGIIANRFIDIIVGITLPFYLKMRGVKMNLKKGGSILFTFLLEFFGLGLDALPFWTGDVLLIMALDKAEKKKEEAAKQSAISQLPRRSNSSPGSFRRETDEDMDIAA